MARLQRLIGTTLLLVAQVATSDTLLTFRQIVDGTGSLLPARSWSVVRVLGRLATTSGDGLSGCANCRSKLTDSSSRVDRRACPHDTYGFTGPTNGDAWAKLFAASAADRLSKAQENAKQTLAIGMTTVRDLFAFEGLAATLKSQLDAGETSGPRMFIAGAGIHPLTLPSPPENGELDLLATFSSIARDRVSTRTDWVKIFATSGTADDLTDTQSIFNAASAASN